MFLVKIMSQYLSENIGQKGPLVGLGNQLINIMALAKRIAAD